MIQDNLDEVNKKFEQIYRRSPQIADELVYRYAFQLLSALIASSPVDTGRLRSNWSQRSVGDAAREISNNTEYVVYTEYASKSPHRGWIENTLRSETSGMRQEIEKEFRRLLGK